MVLLQYCNLLLHKSVERPNQIDIIGEDKASSINNNAHLPVDSAERAEYTAHFVNVTVLVCQHKQLSQLPVPTEGFFDRLERIDLSNCSQISRLPSSIGTNSSVKYLNVATTKLSAIPLTFMESLESLDVSHCRRMTNVGDFSRLRVLNITNSAVVDLSSSTASTLVIMIGLNSKVTHVVGATALKVVMWSGPPSAALHLEGCDDIMSIVTTGAMESITSSGQPYITSLQL